MSSTDIKNAILKCIEAYDHVSFSELPKKVPLNVNSEPNMLLHPESDPNLIFGFGHPVHIDAILELLAEKKIKLTPCPVMVYFVDGRVPHMPLAKRPPKGGYRDPHWAPMVMRLYSASDESN